MFQSDVVMQKRGAQKIAHQNPRYKIIKGRCTAKTGIFPRNQNDYSRRRKPKEIKKHQKKIEVVVTQVQEKGTQIKRFEDNRSMDSHLVGAQEPLSV